MPLILRFAKSQFPAGDNNSVNCNLLLSISLAPFFTILALPSLRVEQGLAGKVMIDTSTNAMTGSAAASNFDFSQPAATAMPGTQVATGTPVALSFTDFERSVVSTRCTVYRWEVTTDQLSWSSNAEQVMGLKPSNIATGKQFAAFLDKENLTSRFDAVVNSKSKDAGAGVRFEIEYQVRSDAPGEKSIWLEDCGLWHADETGRPAQVFGTVRRIDERHLHNQNLVLLSTSDPLTGTLNRSRMTEMLNEVILNSVREHSSCGFAIAAVSNLGVINEAYGFEIADEVILQIARRLRTVMRSGDIIARYSGSKFGFILNNCSPNDLANAGERLLASVRESVIETSRGPVWARLSLGAVSIPESTHDTTTAIAYAEEALNDSRSKPADSCVVYEYSAARQIKHTLNARCASEIVKCLKDGTFILAFQPVIEVATGKIVMHEALLRMVDEQGEIIPAGHLIPVAERIGLIRLIDRNVVQMAITTLHTYPDAILSINISENSAMDSRWNRQLLDLLAVDSQIASRITVELSENAAFSDAIPAKRFIADLQAIGCKVAVDDFGAGYTSFRNVQGLNINLIKLDGSFCHNLKHNANSRFYAKSLIDLGKTFGMKTVAEWVESQEDAEVLSELGIDFMQGHIFGDASIEPPWEARESDSFQLGPQIAAESFQPKEPSPPPSEQSPAVMESDSISEYDYDAGLAALRSTLQLLDTASQNTSSEAAA